MSPLRWKSGLYEVCNLFIFVLLTFVYFNIFRHVPATSDDANNFLAGIDMFSGNPLLNGWTLPPDSYFTEDVFWYGVLSRAIGHNPEVLYILPAMSWSAVVLLAKRIALRNKKGRKLAPILVVATLLFFPLLSVKLNSHMTLIGHAPMHIITLAYILCCLMLLQAHIEKHSPIKLTIYFLLLIVTIAGDPFAIYFCVLPVVIVSTYALYKINIRLKKYWLIAGLSLLSIPLGSAVPRAIHELGGFSPSIIPLQFASFAQLGHNFELLIQGCLIIFGAYFFGLSIKASVPAISRLIYIPLAIRYNSRQIEKLTKAENYEAHFINYVFAASSVLLLLMFLISTVPIDINATRYLIPVLVFSTILIARSVKNGKVFITYASIVLLITLYQDFNGILKKEVPIMGSSNQKLALFLNKNGINLAFAPYWRSSIITVVEQSNLVVRAVIKNGRGLSRNAWLSNKSWYSVPLDDYGSNVAVVWGPTAGFSENDILDEFGKPLLLKHVGDLVVNVYPSSNKVLQAKFGIPYKKHGVKVD